ncbi:MAG: hypothetical protein KY467_13655 [Gemmatimonadetes bacterium]|nr:hypothetical protein [Gemmatimonadota bacterium]
MADYQPLHGEQAVRFGGGELLDVAQLPFAGARAYPRRIPSACCLVLQVQTAFAHGQKVAFTEENNLLRSLSILSS